MINLDVDCEKEYEIDEFFGDPVVFPYPDKLVDNEPCQIDGHENGNREAKIEELDVDCEEESENVLGSKGTEIEDFFGDLGVVSFSDSLVDNGNRDSKIKEKECHIMMDLDVDCEKESENVLGNKGADIEEFFGDLGVVSFSDSLVDNRNLDAKIKENERDNMMDLGVDCEKESENVLGNKGAEIEEFFGDLGVIYFSDSLVDNGNRDPKIKEKECYNMMDLDVEWKKESENVLGNKGTEIEEFFGDLGFVSFSDSLVDNGNRDAKIKELECQNMINVDVEWEKESENVLGNTGTMIEEFFGDLSVVSFSDSLIDNGNRDAKIKEQECHNMINVDAEWEKESENVLGNTGTEIEEFVGDLGVVSFSDSLVDYGNRDANIKDQECHNEKEFEFHVSDIVWGKVRRYLWWPGQIVDPLDLPEKAMKFEKKDCYLIRYFGDNRFAWIEAFRIKPFGLFFSQMEKKSRLKPFCHAVNCALAEVLRQVELGLGCSCLLKEGYDKIKSRVGVNAGIWREYGDGFSDSATFAPEKLVKYLNELAPSPFSVTNRLEVVTATVQLLAFKRWKGYDHLPAFELFDELFEHNNQVPFEDTRYSSSLGSSVGKKWKIVDFASTNLIAKNVISSPKKLGRLGKCIGKVASRQGSIAIKGMSSLEMLSQLYLAATDPLEGCNFFLPFVIYFSNFRNSISLENSNLQKGEKGSHEKQVLFETEREKSIPTIEAEAAFNTSMKSNCEHKTEDSSLQKGEKGNHEKQVLFETEREQTIPTVEAGAAFNTRMKSNCKHEPTLEDNLNDKLQESSVALVLKFLDFDSIPSVTNLNNMFSCYGPLNESETEVLKKSNHAKVVFKRRSDAETAFSSAGKLCMFGPSLVCYKLKYSPSRRTTFTTLGAKPNNKVSKICGSSEPGTMML